VVVDSIFLREEGGGIFFVEIAMSFQIRKLWPKVGFFPSK